MTPLLISVIKSEMTRIEKRIENNNWENMKPGELVALYVWCHNQMYETFPVEMTTKTWGEAKKAAGRLVKNEFNGNTSEAVNYLRWVCVRYSSRMAWQVNRGIPISRLTWLNLFVYKSMLTDYRVSRMVYAKNNKGKISR